MCSEKRTLAIFDPAGFFLVLSTQNSSQLARTAVRCSLPFMSLLLKLGLIPLRRFGPLWNWLLILGQNLPEVLLNPGFPVLKYSKADGPRLSCSVEPHIFPFLFACCPSKNCPSPKRSSLFSRVTEQLRRSWDQLRVQCTETRTEEKRSGLDMLEQSGVVSSDTTWPVFFCFLEYPSPT